MIYAPVHPKDGISVASADAAIRGEYGGCVHKGLGEG